MSLIGIDVGSSSVKAAAYSEEARFLGEASHDLTPIHPEPGLWETDPEDIWKATTASMRSLMTQDSLRSDPPKAIAISASGRENFLADSDGTPLSNGVMGADIRGAEFEIPPIGSPTPEPWSLSCGHLRERMDPVFRLQWWRKYHPEIVRRARYFFGWMDFLVFRMTGRICADRSSASLYMLYDLPSMGWDPKRVAESGMGNDMLPEIPPWGTVVGTLKAEVAEAWGVPPDVKVAQGCMDLNCAAYGAGVHEVGTVCLVSGSYENVLVPTDKLPTAGMLLKGLSVVAHPCRTGLSVIAVHPTGSAVLNWIRDLVGISIEDMESALGAAGPAPAPVMAVPYLSGSMAYWEGGRKARGGLIGLTLATSRADLVQAFMESIAYDTANTLSMMSDEGIEISRIRITGGGARSTWWTQLKADMTNKPVEIVAQSEPGTLGAALLAGLAIGVYNNIEEASTIYAGTKAVYTPDPDRAASHQERLSNYRSLMRLLLEHVY